MQHLPGPRASPGLRALPSLPPTHGGHEPSRQDDLFAFRFHWRNDRFARRAAEPAGDTLSPAAASA
jgi:hypothetical protein